MQCACKVKQIWISFLFWKIAKESSCIWTIIESEIQNTWSWIYIHLFMTKRKMKKNHKWSTLMKIQKFSQKNAKRLNDSWMKKTLSSSRKTFIRNALCVFLTITTSNNKIDETQRPKNHASLLSFEWFTIAGSIRFNLCIKFQLWKNIQNKKSQNFVLFCVF